jgi:alpha-glucosidase (family GH31 glycosyl hydrolase)
MWFEFPKDESLIGLDTQFMFGEHLLVCPKLIKPENDDDKIWAVNCTMPKSSNWYNWYDKISTVGSGFKALKIVDSE